MSNGDKRRPVIVDTKWTLAGGAAAALVSFIAIAGVGQVSSFRGRQLLEATLPTIRFLTSGVLTASVTVLALMLTMLALTFSTELTFHDRHYLRIRQIALLATIAMIMSVGLLMFLSVPIEEAESLRTTYNIVYYAVTIGAACLGGLVVTMVLMLYNAIDGLVAIGDSRGDSHLLAPTNEEGVDEEELTTAAR